MKIAQRVARHFTDPVRSRGQSYKDRGKVKLVTASPELVTASVEGTEKYLVRLRLQEGRLIASCSCPYFHPKGTPCKHLWATLLVVDERKLMGVPPVRSLRLLCDVAGTLVVPPIAGARPGPGQNAPAADEEGAGAAAEAGAAYTPEVEAVLARIPGKPARGDAGRGPRHPRPGSQPPARPHPHPHHRPPSGYYPEGEELGPVDRPAASQPRNGRRPGQQPGPGYGHGPANGNGHGHGHGHGPQHQNQHQQPPRVGGRPGGPPRPGPGAGTVRPGYYGQSQPGRPMGGMAPRPPGPGAAGGQEIATPYGPIVPPAHLRGRALKKWVEKAVAREEKRAALRAAKVAKLQKRKDKADKLKAKRPLYYVLDLPSTLDAHQVVIDLLRRPRPRPDGEGGVGPLQPWSPIHSQGGHPKLVANPDDRVILDLLQESKSDTASPFSQVTSEKAAAETERLARRGRFKLGAEHAVDLIDRMAKTGRLRIRQGADDRGDPPPLKWDDGAAWRFALDIKPETSGPNPRWTWRGGLRRGDARMDIAEPLALLPGLVILSGGRAARFDDVGIYLWMARLRHEKEMTLTQTQQDAMLGKIFAEAKVGPADLIDGLELEEVTLAPIPYLTLRTPRINRASDNLLAELSFDYQGARVHLHPPGRLAVQTEQRRLIRRDQEAERSAVGVLDELGFREADDYRLEPGTRELSPKRMAIVARDLVGRGWTVEADGTPIMPAGQFKLNVTSSGMDWFELSGSVAFGGRDVPLPELLEAARRGEALVTLNDGTMGVLPEEWLRKYSMLADLSGSDGTLRFSRAQAGLLDALLQAQPEVHVDAGFAAMRDMLHRFEGVSPIAPPAKFQGELRPYQKLGLGWLEYLNVFGFGGILADDMGLGKTVQVLAAMMRRKARRLSKTPSLIVVPRSLVFNWVNEAAKFTPSLKVLDYTGPGRHPLREKFKSFDLIVTTYGTLRSDVAELANFEFDHVILDEAQAIKNADSQSAKCARLLKSQFRLAITGTPIENHLGELWSIFEFLNPGMLGQANVFKKFAGPLGSLSPREKDKDGEDGSSKAAVDDGTRALLARAIRPFVLRRTKKQVVEDLPEKSELVLYCDMESEQRQRYEELREHFRAALLGRKGGLGTASHLEVLEALLRLRQAACHPGLISPKHVDQPSAKLDAFLPHLEEVVEEGHKVLVFSQFTKFLAIVRDRLDKMGIAYEYLDGRTRKREEKVERFQNDPDIPVFLISLKAGGLGLNLTAAEYVYLLDPWWNPAVEAQAIDRSHRIGQTQHVFAYRLICRDTVEQKIIELQQRKRELADAILGGGDDESAAMGALTREDLEFLLS